MANGSSRVLAVLLSLIVGFAAGWLLHAPKSTVPAGKDTPAAKTWKIKVGPDPNTLSDLSQGEDEITTPTPVGKKNKDTITWTSHGGKDSVYVVLHLPSACTGKVFANAQPVGKADKQGRALYLLDEKGPKVDSGAIEQDACEGTLIKYDQCLQLKDDKFWCHDGWIIIQP